MAPTVQAVSRCACRASRRTRSCACARSTRFPSTAGRDGARGGVGDAARALRRQRNGAPERCGDARRGGRPGGVPVGQAGPRARRHRERRRAARHRTSSRFSALLSFRHTGYYRALVKVSNGKQVSGTSHTVTCAASPVVHKERWRERPRLIAGPSQDADPGLQSQPRTGEAGRGALDLRWGAPSGVAGRGDRRGFWSCWSRSSIPRPRTGCR